MCLEKSRIDTICEKSINLDKTLIKVMHSVHWTHMFGVIKTKNWLIIFNLEKILIKINIKCLTN